MKAIKDLNMVSVQISKCRENIKNLDISTHDLDCSLNQLILTCLDMIQKFIDNLKYLAKKTSING